MASASDDLMKTIADSNGEVVLVLGAGASAGMGWCL
jgi:hypothetical protein